MGYLAIVDTTAEGKVAKYARFSTAEEAENHVAAVNGEFPNAFAVEDPGGGFAEWVADPASGSISLSSVEERVPHQVTKLQLVRALRAFGKWGEVRSAINSADTVTQEDWDFATVIPRSDPMVTNFASSLGITEKEMDDIFRDASSR